MRQVINKLIREEDLYAAVDAAFSQGWKRVKLYFLIGLPTETDEDTLGIVELAKQCVAIGRRYHKGVTVTASVGGFVPKVQTPFQWFGQNTIEELTRKVHLLRDAARPVRGLTIRWHDPKATAVEGIVSRGDRRMGAVIEQVWRRGGTFQEWSEHFDLELWTEALADHGMSLEDTVYRHRTEHEALPWDHLSAGLHRDFLWQDWLDALADHGLEDCRWTPCYDCGACTGFGIEHVVASAVPPAGGSQGTGQDLSTGGQVPVRFLTTAPSGAGSAPGPDGGRRRAGRGGERLRCAFASASPSSARSASPASGTWPGCGSGPCAGPGCPWPTPRGSRPVPSSASGWPCPPGASRWPSTSTWPSTSAGPRRPASRWPRCPAGSPTCCPTASRWRRRRPVERGAGSLQQLVTSCSWTMSFAGVTRAELEHQVASLLAADVGPHRPGAQGPAGAGRPPAVGAGPGRRPTGRDAPGRADAAGTATVGLVAELATQPRGVRPIELVRGLIAVSGRRPATAADRTGRTTAAHGSPGPRPGMQNATVDRARRHPRGAPRTSGGRRGRRPRRARLGACLMSSIEKGISMSDAATGQPVEVPAESPATADRRPADPVVPVTTERCRRSRPRRAEPSGDGLTGGRTGRRERRAAGGATAEPAAARVARRPGHGPAPGRRQRPTPRASGPSAPPSPATPAGRGRRRSADGRR